MPESTRQGAWAQSVWQTALLAAHSPAGWMAPHPEHLCPATNSAGPAASVQQSLPGSTWSRHSECAEGSSGLSPAVPGHPRRDELDRPRAVASPPGLCPEGRSAASYRSPPGILIRWRARDLRARTAALEVRRGPEVARAEVMRDWLRGRQGVLDDDCLCPAPSHRYLRWHRATVAIPDCDYPVH